MSALQVQLNARRDGLSRYAGSTKMARPEGFEPPTNGFGSHYSIRLSYGRTGGAF